MTNSKPSPDTGAEIQLLKKIEVADFLRIKVRTIAELSKRWEKGTSATGETHPSSPNLGLRPTRVTPKMVLYDMRDVREYLANARLEQEGKPPISLVGVES